MKHFFKYKFQPVRYITIHHAQDVYKHTMTSDAHSLNFGRKYYLITNSIFMAIQSKKNLYLYAVFRLKKETK